MEENGVVKLPEKKEIFGMKSKNSLPIIDKLKYNDEDSQWEDNMVN
jgi:hypothetical protein